MAAVALEQRRADASLERFDLLRERRRRDVQALRGAAEVQLLGDGDEERSWRSSAPQPYASDP